MMRTEAVYHDPILGSTLEPHRGDPARFGGFRRAGTFTKSLVEWYKHTRFHPDCPWVCHLKGRKLNSIKAS